MRLDRHEPEDRQSLLMHTESVRMVISDPSLKSRLVEILDHWDKVCTNNSKSLRDQWRLNIASDDWASALSTSERGNQIRQASPMSCILPNEKRLAIIRQISDEKAELRAKKLN